MKYLCLLYVSEGSLPALDSPAYAGIAAANGAARHLLECADLDEAVRWAETIPAARYGSVEVRPVVDVGRPG